MKFFLLLLTLYKIKFSYQKLKSVYTIIRHGARTSDSYKLDFNAKLYGPYMKMTLNGYQQSQNLGRTLRNRYINKLKFLDEKYNKRQISFKTGLSQRTIFSLYGIITGLYPDNLIEIKYDNKDLSYPPNNNFDIPFFGNENFDSNEEKIKLKILSSSDELNLHPIKFKGGIIHPNFSLTQDEIDSIKKNLGQCIDDFDLEDEKKKTLSSLSDLYFSYEYSFKNELNKCISKKTVNSIYKGKLDKWYNRRNQEIKLIKDDIFSKIIEQFENKENYFSIYIGHITICRYIIKSLFNDDFIINTGIKGIEDKESFEFLICPYAGSFIFELYENEYNNEQYVQILINGKVVKDKNAFLIKDIEIIDGKIPYDKFKDLFKITGKITK